ncbi:hypothetical protein CBR_g34235 [Chara braunii]|uniref:Integrase catalytic domain-containing protein n=1 Tax=Chara braunii TaxID=69332 RepID=A0A388JYH7_CHABU|nr:hypothetical protein CBR_g34235 [Chara braunii]|eukprot:GBG62864.1 hypothetical protein CBR_g34235 [Chara braunii]
MKVGTDDFLLSAERDFICELCQKYSGAFSFNDEERGRLDVDMIKMVKIWTVPHTPWNDRPTKYAQKEEKEVMKYINQKIASNIAEPADDAYANHWFCFWKPGGGMRWIQNLQKLNSITVRDAGSLPNVDLLDESFAGRSIYSLIDLYAGYDQFPIDPTSRPMTAMHTPRGLIQMCVMPQGWTNGVAVVQRDMLKVMEDICPEVTFPYIDDNPVKGPKEKDKTIVDGRVRRFVWEHAQGVAKVLERLFKYNLTASGPKSLLFQREVTILGFRCFLKGRSPDPKKVDKILNWPMPLRTVGEVRSLLGVCSFWRIFIPGFVRVAEPLREMVRQGASLGWSDQRKKVARTLQDKLRDGGVVLGVPYFDDERERPFIIEADDGPIALGGVLVQRDENGKERSLRFESRTLNSVERGYIQFRKEHLAILHCLRVFRHYIMGRRFILRTDSTAVIGAVKRHQQVDATVSRWIAHILTYDFISEKVPTDKNRVDGLGRVEWGSIDDESLEEAPFVDEFLMGDDDEGLPLAPNCYTTSVMATSREDCWGEKEDPYLHYLLIQEDKEEGWYGMVEQAAIAAHELAESSRVAERRLNEIEDESEDLERSKDDEGRFRAEEYDGEYKRIGMVMSSNQLDEFYHERTKRTFRLRRGHLFVDAKEGLPPLRVVCGRERQLEVIAALHEGLAGGHRGADATYYKVSRLYHWDGLRDMVMRYCKSCEACQKISSMRLIESLYPTVLVEPGSTVHLDLITMPPGKDEMKYILNMRDNMSGYVEAKAIRKKTAKTVADWIEEIYLRYIFIREFVADQGSEFKNEMVRKLMFRLGVRVRFVTPYHFQANAPVERGHMTLRDAISKWCRGDSRSWPSFLRAAVYA